MRESGGAAGGDFRKSVSRGELCKSKNIIEFFFVHVELNFSRRVYMKPRFLFVLDMLY